jgi:methylthioribose-1-phosphate isomerase
MAALKHPSPISGASYSAVELMPDNGRVELLDQRLLPREVVYYELRQVSEIATAIKDMWVRGAPAIGVAAAYGMVLAAHEARSLAEWRACGEQLTATRPTAVNLHWAVERMLHQVGPLWSDQRATRVERAAEEARRIHTEDVAANRRMGALGAEFVPDDAVIITHCNAGALATGGFGTALGVVRAAHRAGKSVSVLACETRPWLQGARLTAWELQQDGIDVRIICDNNAAATLARDRISLCIVGADRIARSGDVANKIGTYSLAIAAKWHGCPFFVAAPWSTVDLACVAGSAIPIEERDASEVTCIAGVPIGPEGVGARNPAFDVTPADLVSAIITERGVVQPVNAENLNKLAPAET